jgi:hypothetical protein
MGKHAKTTSDIFLALPRAMFLELLSGYVVLFALLNDLPLMAIIIASNSQY